MKTKQTKQSARHQKPLVTAKAASLPKTILLRAVINRLAGGSVTQFSAAVRADKSTVYAVLRGAKPFTRSFAATVETTLGLPSEFFSGSLVQAGKVLDAVAKMKDGAPANGKPKAKATNPTAKSGASRPVAPAKAKSNPKTALLRAVIKRLARGSVAKFSADVRVDKSTVYAVLRGARPFTPTFAATLEETLKLPSGFFGASLARASEALDAAVKVAKPTKPATKVPAKVAEKVPAKGSAKGATTPPKALAKKPNSEAEQTQLRSGYQKLQRLRGGGFELVWHQPSGVRRPQR